MSFPVLNAVAEREVERAIRYYLIEAGQAIAADFYTAFVNARNHVAEFPHSGSTRYGEMIGAPLLRSWRLKRFPYVMFYVVHETQIEIIHLLHLHSDISKHLQDEDQT
jgi:toxin ParE1/3/4